MSGYALIKLGRSEAMARVDIEDLERVGARGWEMDCAGYVVNHGRLLHRVVMDAR